VSLDDQQALRLLDAKSKAFVGWCVHFPVLPESFRSKSNSNFQRPPLLTPVPRAVGWRPRRMENFRHRIPQATGFRVLTA
jgi:hypothetical protein